MNQTLKEKTVEAFSAVLPITAIVLLLSVLVVPLDLGPVSMFLVGAVLLVIGMGFFQLGAEIAMTPLGEGVGVELAKSKRVISIIAISFVMGVLITIAEPDLQVLANQVPSIPNNTLIWTIAVGVGIFLSIAILRIFNKASLSLTLLVLYIILFIVSIFTPPDFLAVAFDAGGVTTGPITVPFIIAMGVGMASSRTDKNAADDSFGLVALSSVGPILAVLILGIFYNPSDASYSHVEIPEVYNTRDVLLKFLHAIPHYAKEVLWSLLPVIAVFLIFKLATGRFHKRQFARMLFGFLYTYIGLVLFLTGVNEGFGPVGSLLGSQLVASNWRWLLIPIGMLIGYFIVKAEPAVQVLNRQVEDVTNGGIPESAMNLCLSIGVAISVGLAMLRILTGLPIYWIIIPGYAIALILSRIVPTIFVGIAFDSGGVASGPMTSTFLLPLSIGACEALGGNVMTDAFGVVAMVAMTPLIAVQIMGLVYASRMKKQQAIEDMNAASLDDSDEIIEFEEAAEND